MQYHYHLKTVQAALPCDERPQKLNHATKYFTTVQQRKQRKHAVHKHEINEENLWRHYETLSIERWRAERVQRSTFWEVGTD